MPLQTEPYLNDLTPDQQCKFSFAAIPKFGCHHDATYRTNCRTQPDDRQ
jgi:hypothetical protein